jgi:hypothetical protein
LPYELQRVEFDSYLIDDSALEHLESEMNGFERGEKCTVAEWLNKIMSHSTAWILAFLDRWEDVSVVATGSPEDALKELHTVLTWGNRHGFIIYRFDETGEG